MIPALFVSHGSPQLVLEGGEWGRDLRRAGEKILSQKPSLALVVSAHWITDSPCLESSERPKTIHDFSGFGEDLYRFEYPATGDPDLVREIAEHIGAEVVVRGLDHGAWAVLSHLFPKGEVPVTQMSIPSGLSLEDHVRLGSRLRDLRDWVVVIGSGGAVHNLMDALLRPKDTPSWAVEFNEFLKEVVLKRDMTALLNYRNDLGKVAHPTEEHIIPIFYFLSSLTEEERVEVLYDGFEFGSISLLSFISTP